MMQQENSNRLILGQNIYLGPEIARGGEGIIYAIKGRSGQVAKIFHRNHITREKDEKLKAMIANPPYDPADENEGHISIAWPLARIFDKKGKICIGFTMSYINPDKSFPLLKIYNPLDRKKTNLNFTWEYLLFMAHNLTIIVKELHRKGYVIGDLNESNVLVSREAKVTLVDCDTIQVPKFLSGREHIRAWLFPSVRDYFLCTVGKVEYTPPELQGKSFSAVVRKTQHDNFSLAVLIFLILMEGRHPFASTWFDSGEAPSLAESIRYGYFPYYTYSKKFGPPRYAIPFRYLPPKVQQLMLRCFRSNFFILRGLRMLRPGAARWERVLAFTKNHLADCEKNSQHVYSDHLQGCPWCQRVDQGLPDPFPATYSLTPRAAQRRRRAYFRSRWYHILSRTAVLLPPTLWVVAFFTWRFYSSWFVRQLPQTGCLLFMLFMFLPVALGFIFYLAANKIRP